MFKLYNMNVRKIALIIFVICFLNMKTFAHCEIPCGIYHDSMRVELLKEHISTIEKSMLSIAKLEKEDNINYNQIVRWVYNKEIHADKIQTIATQYFMFQRIKILKDKKSQKKNNKMLTLLHKLCIYAMKSKQTTDLNNIHEMNKVLEEFSQLYFNGHIHHHK